MESKMDQKLDMFLERMAERFDMNNRRPAVAAAADESDNNGPDDNRPDDNRRVHQMRSKDRKLHRKEVAVSFCYCYYYFYLTKKFSSSIRCRRKSTTYFDKTLWSMS